MFVIDDAFSEKEGVKNWDGLDNLSVDLGMVAA